MPGDLTEFGKEPPDVQLPPEWVRSVEDVIRWGESESGIAHRNLAISFLLIAFGFVLVATFGIFYLQGFKVGGFDLDPKLLYWLGAATVGEIGGLAALVYGALFRGRKGTLEKPVRRERKQSKAPAE